jgi:hypothetical protein
MSNLFYKPNKLAPQDWQLRKVVKAMQPAAAVAAAAAAAQAASGGASAITAANSGQPHVNRHRLTHNSNAPKEPTNSCSENKDWDPDDVSTKQAESFTTFLKDLWSTLAVVDALLVGVAGQMFCAMVTHLMQYPELRTRWTIVASCCWTGFLLFSILSMVVSVFYYGYLLPYPPTSGAMIQFWDHFGRFCGLPILLTIVAAGVFVLCIIMHGIYMLRHGFELPTKLQEERERLLKEHIKQLQADCHILRQNGIPQGQPGHKWQTKDGEELRSYEMQLHELKVKKLQHERLQLPRSWWGAPLAACMVVVVIIVLAVVAMYWHSRTTYML